MQSGQPATLTVTEALAKGTFRVGIAAINASTARQVPYAELYHARTAIMATPVEFLQQAAEDEKRREADKAEDA